MRLRALAAAEEEAMMQRLGGTLTLSVRLDMPAGIIITLALLVALASR